MNRKTLVLPAALGLLAPVLAACGTTDSGSSSGDAIVVGTTDRFTASEEAPAPVDPAYAYDVGTWNILRQTVQTLLVQPRGDGEPEPEAASDCRFTDTGNERYVCTLRSGLKFADGSPITAEDVKFSIDRARAIKADSGVYGLLSTIDLVETKGDKEVIFHLNSPDATLPYKLSTPVAGIVNPADYDKDKLRDGFEVDGSGPYTLDAQVENNELVKAVFTKNPHYKGQLDPKNDKVELRSFTSADAMGTALKDGDIDLMTRTMTPEQISELSKSDDGDIDLIEAPGLEIRYLAFNTDAAPVDSTAVRQAMAEVIDRSEIVSQVYGSQAEPLFSLVPAGITGHSNSFFNKYGDPSVGKARTVLEKAGITTPVKLTLHYTTDHYGAATKKEFELLKKQLDDSDLFDVTIKGAPWSTFRPAGKKGEYAVYGMGWFPDFPDADNYLAPFLDKDNFLHSPYANSEIRSKLIPESRRAEDRLNAAESLTGIQDIVADDVPVLPLWQGNQYVAARDNVTGAEYALNSASTLQLWELGRGMDN
ncbi:peptide-binding protein [Streptomyces ipomoeae]|uniref:ABC transporter, substrate-binding protein, family 5 n=2 Tax=Streptomyces ipomoeae TaxID=103232 RepID=L1KPB5_9ACTN|nr:ABC transporter substrate-binding protein [Streptomyces ipomoeae]EKX62651.1 ABC transporter, substrate-binding protein, family 5 [Streptomyces ipomoeae 91-03]MDX2698811.1 ABC transporter substrate-binding protein [Streptomyces ipomoeae]MDX2827174.1 ABC transporter substrate-binding protein [Streptomyces ipomoeae]MDX2839909.1 ABC transporter substrate-binding protein [Streptomyces ipomoeae]MDX2878874.1 ABC transporter substrate-binding protein [Streptomyces ipomoeae]